ncbi:MAG: hypothetical protein WC212_03180 [Candidatus Delongbacteria bacterium]
MDHDLTKHDILIDYLLENKFDTATIANFLKGFHLADIDFKNIMENSESEYVYSLNQKDLEITENICLPLKRQNYFKEAFSIYKYIYLKSGPSAILYFYLYEIFACSLKFEEAISLITSAILVCENYEKKNNTKLKDTTRFKNHWLQFMKMFSKNGSLTYLYVLADNNNFVPDFVNLD